MDNGIKGFSASLIIGLDFTHGVDKSVLIVGTQSKGQMKILNAFQGAEAVELFNKLTTVKKEES